MFTKFDLVDFIISLPMIWIIMDAVPENKKIVVGITLVILMVYKSIKYRLEDVWKEVEGN